MKGGFFARLVFLILVAIFFQSITRSEELSPEFRGIVAVSTGTFFADDKQLLTESFIRSVNTWLRKYDPELISKEENVIRMRASYRSLYDLELIMNDGIFQISARLAKPVVRKGRAQKLAAHLATGLMRLVRQDLAEPERLRQVERDKEREAQRLIEEARRAKEEEDQRKAKIASVIAEDQARIKEMKSLGPVRAYPALASYRYKKCEQLANVFLDSDLKKFSELFESGLKSVKECSAAEEVALAGEVRTALTRASDRVSGQIKNLHAYTVASLRALTNFHQSAIEARQARAERSAGIDERTTRLELEL